MGDHVYSGDFFLDAGFTVKQEPISMDTANCMTASMPIPGRKIMDMSELRDFGIEFVDTLSPVTSNDMTSNISNPGMQESSVLYQTLSGSAMWGTRHTGEGEVIRPEPFRMDDDDIFQVDKADLIQGPTLAELNANDENLLEDLNFDDLLLPEENSSYFINVPVTSVSALKYTTIPPMVHVTNHINNNNNNNQQSGSSLPTSSYGFYKNSVAPSQCIPCPDPLTPSSHHSSSSSLFHHSATSSVTPPLGVSPLQQKHSTLHELLLKKEAMERPQLGQSVPGCNVAAMEMGHQARYGRMPHTGPGYRLSSSAPTHLGLDIWQRREPRQHLLSTGSLAEAGSTSSLSTGGVLSPESHDFSHDEGFDSEDDSDHYEDFSSDGDSSDGEGAGPSRYPSNMSKKERYFWQYNVQAKGPKGQRLVLKTRLEDPHVLNEVTDPVFSPQCSVRGIKHSGKARKGDGNDLTPNPRKLCSIGRELDKLSRIINDMTPVSELPFNVRPKTRKEKNKLASRACRLKKKAQHEANKLKLYGLEHEHKRLNMGIYQIKQLLAAKFTTETLESQEDLTNQIEKISKSVTKVKIAGFTTDFVNKVLDKVKSGVPGGGLDDM